MLTKASNDNLLPDSNSAICSSTLEPNKRVKTRKRKFKSRLREKEVIQPRRTIIIHESETYLCTALWRAVVIQALYDVSGKGGNAERRLIRAEANSWFSSKSANDNIQSNFEYICELANLRPERVLMLVKQVRKKGECAITGINSRTMRKDYSSRIQKRKCKVSQ